MAVDQDQPSLDLQDQALLVQDYYQRLNGFIDDQFEASTNLVDLDEAYTQGSYEAEFATLVDQTEEASVLKEMYSEGMAVMEHLSDSLAGRSEFWSFRDRLQQIFYSAFSKAVLCLGNSELEERVFLENINLEEAINLGNRPESLEKLFGVVERQRPLDFVRAGIEQEENVRAYRAKYAHILDNPEWAGTFFYDTPRCLKSDVDRRHRQQDLLFANNKNTPGAVLASLVGRTNDLNLAVAENVNTLARTFTQLAFGPPLVAHSNQAHFDHYEREERPFLLQAIFYNQGPNVPTELRRSIGGFLLERKDPKDLKGRERIVSQVLTSEGIEFVPSRKIPLSEGEAREHKHEMQSRDWQNSRIIKAIQRKKRMDFLAQHADVMRDLKRRTFSVTDSFDFLPLNS